MAYCPRCGNKNEEDAAFCKNCGTPMHGAPDKYDRQRDRDQRCEEDCGGGPAGHGWRIFWGVIIILIGLAIFFEVVLKNLSNTYPDLRWVTNIQWDWIFGGVVALVIILVGVRVITRHH